MGGILAAAAHKTSNGAYGIFAGLFVLGFSMLFAGGFMPVKNRRTRLRLIFGGILIAAMGSVVLIVDGL